MRNFNLIILKSISNKSISKYLLFQYFNIFFFKYILLIIFFCSFIKIGFSQIEIVEKMELENHNYMNQIIVPVNENLWVLSKKYINGSENEWKHLQYSSNFDLLDTIVFNLSQNQEFKAKFTTNDHVHEIFKNKGKSYSLISIDIKTNEYIIHKGSFPRQMTIKKMTVMGDYVYFKTISISSVYFFAINWRNGNLKNIPLQVKKHRNKKLVLSNIQLLPVSNKILLYINTLYINRLNDTYVQFINENAEIEKTILLNKGSKFEIIHATASETLHGQFLFFGTYTTEKLGDPEGIFSCKFSDNDTSNSKLYNFLNLEYFSEPSSTLSLNIFSFYKSSSYTFISHNILKYGKAYVLVCEAYVPTYKSLASTHSSLISDRKFDGYKGKNALIAYFDSTGILQWEQFFFLESNYRPHKLQEFIKITIDEDLLKILFPVHSTIISKTYENDGIIRKNWTVDQLLSEPIKTTKYYNYTELEHWYKDYFIAKTGNKHSANRKKNVEMVYKIKY